MVSIPIGTIEGLKPVPTSLDTLKPSDSQIAVLFLPYISERKRRYLGLALDLCLQGSLEGERPILGGNDIPFVATWMVRGSILPSDTTRCRVVFDCNPDFSYEIIISYWELVDHLIEVIVNYRRHRRIDFSKAFYARLLQFT